VPQAVQDQRRHDQCLERLDAWREQVPHGWVPGDDALGRHTRFRHELRERGERYVLGVPCTTTMRALEAPWPEYQGRGRRPKAPWHSVSAWRQCRDADAWTRLRGRDGEKGPVAIEMVKRRVQTRIERKRTGPDEWLVVTRHPLADDRTLEPRASRDATDQDARYRDHDDLTPTDGPEVAFKEPALGELARVIKAGSCIEASFQRGKGEVGMDAYQVGRIRARYLPARLPNPPVRPVRETFASYGSRQRDMMGKVHFASSTVHSPWTALRVRWVPVSCFPTRSLRAFAMCAVFPHSDSYALFDCLLGLGVS
jgi:hypothetical protein